MKCAWCKGNEISLNWMEVMRIVLNNVIKAFHFYSLKSDYGYRRGSLSLILPALNKSSTLLLFRRLLLYVAFAASVSPRSGYTIGTVRQTLCVGSTSLQSTINCLYDFPTARIFRSKSYKPRELTLPLFSRRAESQST